MISLSSSGPGRDQVRSIQDDMQDDIKDDIQGNIQNDIQDVLAFWLGRLGLGLVVLLRLGQVRTRPGMVQILLSLQLKFNSLELDFEIGRFVLKGFKF